MRACVRRAALVAALLPAIATVVQAQDPWRYAHITYLTSATAYLDAGRDEGLREGLVLAVVRGADSVAALQVTDLSTHRAAATILPGGASLALGDSARFVAPAAPAPVLAAATEGAPTGSRSARAPRTLRGRIGVRYFWLGSQLAADMSQPALDLRLDGTRLGGTDFGLHVDVRARWIITSQAQGTTSSAQSIPRAYQAAVTWEPRTTPLRIVAGRQMSPTLATVNFLDGVTVQYLGRHVTGGAFGGFEPDATLGFSTALRSVGGFAQFHAAPGSNRNWTFTVGAAGSYTDAATNREFLFLQGGYVDRILSLFVAQEIDYYRPWKVELGEQPISPTSTFATARVNLTDGFSLLAGYDNRRSVRLYSDVVNPEVAFDADFRQGVWGGASARVAHVVLLGADVRTNGGGSAGRSNAYTVNAGLVGLTRIGLAVRGRSTRYENDQGDGWLHSLSVAASPWIGMTLELNGGTRVDRDIASTQSIAWYGANLDVPVTRSLYLLLSATHEQGSLDATDQAYASLTMRF